MHPSSFGCDSRRRPPDRDPEERQRRLELVSGGHLNAPPLPSVDPDRLTCGVRVLTVFPSPPRRRDQRKRTSEGKQCKNPDLYSPFPPPWLCRMNGSTDEPLQGDAWHRWAGGGPSPTGDVPGSSAPARGRATSALRAR